MTSDWGVVHLIAIGGAGMSVIAHLLLERGVIVQGSDMNDSLALRRLEEAGAKVWVGHDGKHTAGIDTVIVSSAIKADNPELVAARAAGVTVLHRSQALAALAAGNNLVAVAGAHGKTTTSAMITVALRAMGQDPSAAIGSTISTATGPISGGHAGRDSVMVIEADESDGSFLNYEPSIAVVTNIEPDHLDHYATEEAFEQAFVDFVARVVTGGLVVTSADDPGTSRLMGTLDANARATNSTSLVPGDTVTPRIATFGRTAEAHYRMTDITIPGQQAMAEATVRLPSGDRVSLRLQVPGEHNLFNATAALIALIELGADPADAAAALGDFRGTGRRFDLRGQIHGIRVVDDYAHHPTEVAALVAAARTVVADGRVIVVFQPHLYSRTAAFATEFANALQGTDIAFVTDVYAAREAHRDDIGPWTIVDAAASDSALVALPDMREAGRRAADLAVPGDLIVLAGAGDIATIGDEVVQHLTQRWSQQ